MYFFICWKFPKFLNVLIPSRKQLWVWYFGGLLLSQISKFTRQFLSIKCLFFEKFHFLGNFLGQMYKLTQKRLETLKWKKLAREFSKLNYLSYDTLLVKIGAVLFSKNIPKVG